MSRFRHRFAAAGLALAACIGMGFTIPAAASASASASVAAPSGRPTGWNTARFELPAPPPVGQSTSTTVTLPNHMVAKVSVSSVVVTPDWNNVFQYDMTCRTSITGVVTSWWHVYEGMSGNGSAVTNVTYPNDYWSPGPLSVEVYTDPAPNYFIQSGKGYLINGTEFGNGWGPASVHDIYYMRMIVNGNGTWNSGTYATLTCGAIG